MYLSVSENAVSAALFCERGAEQMPVYYVSKTLVSAETRYLPLEKLVLALIVAARKLPHYFQSNPIVVYTEFPVKSLLRKADFSGRIATWAVELSQYEIEYQPRTAIKGQVLADFVAEFTPGALPPPPGLVKEAGVKSQLIATVTEQSEQLPAEQGGASLGPPVKDPEEWQLYVDGSACNKGSGVGVVLIAPDGVALELSIRLGFHATNNVAEYEAFLAGLRSARTLKVAKLRVHCDSRLVVNQLSGEFALKNDKMTAYAEQAKELMREFEQVHVEQITSGQNAHADALACLASAMPTEMKTTGGGRFFARTKYLPNREEGAGDRVGPKLDGPNREVSQERDIARGQKGSTQDQTQGGQVLAISRGEIVQKVLYWAIFTVCTP